MQRILRSLLVTSLATIIVFPIASFAQTRKRTTTTKPKATRTAAPPKASEVQREGAARVAEQIKILTRFIYLLGGVAKGLEGVDDATRRNEASPAVMEQAQKNKQQVRASISGGFPYFACDVSLPYGRSATRPRGLDRLSSVCLSAECPLTRRAQGWL